MDKWVGLLDCNNFFVSCERLFRPDLKTTPVVVLSSNDGCIVARSKEIKDKGIPMGVPYFQVKDSLKDIEAVTFSSHFALYRDVSRRVFEVMRSELGSIEQYSIDEAFFVVEGDIVTVRRCLQSLKDRVEREVGIPVSVAAASSKTLAKYAGSIAKKTGGVHVMTMESWQDISKSVLLTELWGVAYRSAKHYGEKGIRTAAELMVLSRAQVEQHFGVHGMRLFMELSGQPAVHINRSLFSQKSILSSRSFEKTTIDKEVVKDAVAYHVRHAAEDLRAMHKRTAFIQVTISPSRHGDYVLQGGSRAIEILPTNDSFVLLKAANVLVDELFRPGVPYKKAGVLLTSFIPETVEQGVLFGGENESQSAKLMPLIDKLNQRSGREVVLLGGRLKTGEWQASSRIKSPAYTTDWKSLKVVKA
jgi:DNA polymerase V